MENPHLDYREPPRPAAVESALDKSKVSTALKSMGHTAEEAISVEDVPVPRPTREPRYRKEPTPGTTVRGNHAFSQPFARIYSSFEYSWRY